MSPTGERLPASRLPLVFIEGLAEMQAPLETLETEATELSSVIRHNVKQLIGDE